MGLAIIWLSLLPKISGSLNRKIIIRKNNIIVIKQSLIIKIIKGTIKLVELFINGLELVKLWRNKIWIIIRTNNRKPIRKW